MELNDAHEFNSCITKKPKSVFKKAISKKIQHLLDRMIYSKPRFTKWLYSERIF